MIATLRGEIVQIEDSSIVVEVGGVGLRVFVPAPLRARMKIGEGVFLYTHLVVREDALSLYGFESQAERDLFNMLLGVDGVGPKVSLSVLSTLTLDIPDEILVVEYVPKTTGLISSRSISSRSGLQVASKSIVGLAGPFPHGTIITMQGKRMQMTGARTAQCVIHKN